MSEAFSLPGGLSDEEDSHGIDHQDVHSTDNGNGEFGGQTITNNNHNNSITATAAATTSNSNPTT